ncbi:MAG: efflux transporter outer membrane subunit [Thermodesulfobacteriota bacterium]
MMGNSEQRWRRGISPDSGAFRGCRRLALALACLPLLVGCAVGPDYQPPHQELPDAWVGRPPGEGKPLPGQELARWWQGFGDPLLASLVERAIAGNLDLGRATARVRQARAARSMAMTGFGPALDAAASLQHGNSRLSTTATTPAAVGDLYQTGFDAAWEIDLFGGTRRAFEAAGADLLAAEEGRRGVLVSLAAEVAASYINLRTLQERLAVLRRNRDAQEHTARIIRQRYEAGMASRLDLASAEAQAASTAALVPGLESALGQAMHGIALLLGMEPGALLAELSPAAPVPAGALVAHAGVPAELLRRRPDIRQAEALLHAATARIGVATADLFPRITLSASLAMRGTTPAAASEWANRLWSLGPGLGWRLFESGRNLANLELHKAKEEEALLGYRQTVLAALAEVESALLAEARERDRQAALTGAVASQAKAAELALARYEAGVADFLAVLDARRSLLAAEDALAQGSGSLASSRVALYKALGGGWQEAGEEGKGESRGGGKAGALGEK